MIRGRFSGSSQAGKLLARLDPDEEECLIRSLTVRSALATAGGLFGGLAVGLAAGTFVNGLPMHLPERTMNVVASLPAMAGLAGGGALWGNLMARITDQESRRRMTIAGALGFGPVVLALAFALLGLEIALVERGGAPNLPIHVVFTLLFVPAAFVTGAVGGAAIGTALGDRGLAIRAGLASGTAGAAAFLIVDLAMDAFGWRVGGPGAAARATMVTVTALGALGAALAGGAALGWTIDRAMPAEIR